MTLIFRYGNNDIKINHIYKPRAIRALLVQGYFLNSCKTALDVAFTLSDMCPCGSMGIFSTAVWKLKELKF